MSCVGRLSARQHFPILLLCRERNLWPAYGRWMRIRSVVDIELVIWQTTTTYGDQMFVLVCRRQNRFQFVSHMRLFSAFSRRSVLSIFLEFVLRGKPERTGRAYGFKFSSLVSQPRRMFRLLMAKRKRQPLWNENFCGNMSIIRQPHLPFSNSYPVLHASSHAWNESSLYSFMQITMSTAAVRWKYIFLLLTDPPPGTRNETNWSFVLHDRN